MKRRNLIILLINILTLTSCMRADACIAYFYSFDEESSFRYVQVSKKYLGYTVDEYHYKEGKYDGDIEININIPNEINGVPVTSMGNSSYRLKKTVYKYHDSAYLSNIACTMQFAIIANDFFSEDCNLTVNYYIPQNIKSIYFGGGFVMFANKEFVNNEKDKAIMYRNCSFNFNVDENNQCYYSKDGKLFCKGDGIGGVSGMSSITSCIMRCNIISEEECQYICTMK